MDNIAAEVAAASREQSQGVAQISIAVGQVDKVTQSNSSSAEASAEAAQQLNGQTQAMQHAIEGLLKLVGESTQASTPAAATVSQPQTTKKGSPANGNGNGHGRIILKRSPLAVSTGGRMKF